MKVSAFIKGSKTRMSFHYPLRPIRGTMVVKSATVFWKYKNITPGTVGVTRPVQGGTQTTYLNNDGYYDINALINLLGQLDLEATFNKNTGKVSVDNTGSDWVIMNDALKVLLGFSSGNIPKDGTRVGDKIVDAHIGLRYIKVHCSEVDTQGSIDENGNPSSCLVNLHVGTKTLISHLQIYRDIESAVKVLNAGASYIDFWVTDQDGKEIDVGEILLDLYVY